MQKSWIINFTASVEKEFDEIADGKVNWNDMISRFYSSFHKKVEETLSKKKLPKQNVSWATILKAENRYYARMARFGAVAQIGETNGDRKAQVCPAAERTEY